MLVLFLDEIQHRQMEEEKATHAATVLELFEYRFDALS
jgi:hypothetical protein